MLQIFPPHLCFLHCPVWREEYLSHSLARSIQCSISPPVWMWTFSAVLNPYSRSSPSASTSHSKPLSHSIYLHIYFFQVQAKNDFSYDFYNSSWSYVKTTELQVRSNFAGNRDESKTISNTREKVTLTLYFYICVCMGAYIHFRTGSYVNFYTLGSFSAPLSFENVHFVSPCLPRTLCGVM